MAIICDAGSWEMYSWVATTLFLTLVNLELDLRRQHKKSLLRPCYRLVVLNNFTSIIVNQMVKSQGGVLKFKQYILVHVNIFLLALFYQTLYERIIIGNNKCPYHLPNPTIPHKKKQLKKSLLRFILSVY